ncbi:MAG: ribonucleoside-diphosphate reductase subunit alpha [Chlamydiales bacterium]|nr:ribonucleoside-diphosphate reductase subunit alpha [Chlamydiia bacterium]MCP5507532.1 ribonucleoside-diphosphate reductase subunit alpha [Chlamydiales bacterium]
METLCNQSQQLVVRKRNGKNAVFDRGRIKKAITGAFQEFWGISKGSSLDDDKSQIITTVTDAVMEKLNAGKFFNGEIDVERIQDIVEIILMRLEHYEVARLYILYRAEHAKARKIRDEKPRQLTIKLPNGEEEPYDRQRLTNSLLFAFEELDHCCSLEELVSQIEQQLFNGVTPTEIRKIAILTVKGMIEQDPAYDQVACRILLSKIKKESLERLGISEDARVGFLSFIQAAVDQEFLNPELLDFDLNRLAQHLDFKRDTLLPFIGVQALYDRYFIRFEEIRVELPQYFWMRVAMGLALKEDCREERAIEFYNLISQLKYVPSTPTLFNSGTPHSQLSSCYLLTVDDDLENIFKVIGDNAKLSKWAGGLGNDWTPIRSSNAYIKGTKGKSQGLIPFLKLVNDTAVAVNQGGKRKGAVCCYLETWHLDVEEFLDLRKNTGDDRRRTHDMNTANWIPDLFMKRVIADASWTLFSPDEVPDLHDLYGQEFEERYAHYEKCAAEGEIRNFREISARQLWRKMLSRLFETGHPWITFKDPSNLRSSQRHAGVIHSSNLCTEILLNTSKQETAVCNLGSINLVAHLRDGAIDEKALQQSIATAVRMLDNVIDINFYPTDEARHSNLRHRPIGIGLMGFHDTLIEMGIPYDSMEAVAFADRSMELISYHALAASSALAEERGSYPTYQGSSWSKGIVPIDTIRSLQEARGGVLNVDTTSTLNWDPLRRRVKEKGMRNSQVLAIAPTATISLIAGVSQSIEPIYAYLFVKSNLSGETTAVDSRLVQELKNRNLWDRNMLDELKYHDGSVQAIERIPADLKRLFKGAFEIAPEWLIEAAARRQKWIDMGQSLNLYLSEASGKKLDLMYRQAWEKGLKTTYYLRTKAATQVEKSTLDVNRFGIQPKWMKSKSASSEIQVKRSCSIDGECEACQ